MPLSSTQFKILSWMILFIYVSTLLTTSMAEELSPEKVKKEQDETFKKNYHEAATAYKELEKAALTFAGGIVAIAAVIIIGVLCICLIVPLIECIMSCTYACVFCCNQCSKRDKLAEANKRLSAMEKGEMATEHQAKTAVKVTIENETNNS